MSRTGNLIRAVALSLAVLLVASPAPPAPLAGTGEGPGQGVGPVATPRSVRAVAGNAAVHLSWEPPAPAGAELLAYVVYRRVAGEAACRLLVSLPPTATSFTDYLVSNGVTYAYEVAALARDGTEGPRSGPVEATPAEAGLELILTLGSPTALVNGLEVLLDAPAEAERGWTMVPLRFVGENLGVSLEYDAARRAVTVTLGDRVVRLWVDRTTAEVDGRLVPLGAPPVLSRGRVLVPLRFLGEVFGAEVGFEATLGRVTLRLPDEDAHPSAATDLTPGKPVVSSLAGPDDLDFYSCSLEAGRTYRVLVEPLDAAVDPVLVVVDPALDPAGAALVAVDDNPPGGRSAELEVNGGTEGGTVLFRVQAATGPVGSRSGSYRILVEDRTEPEDTPSGATPLEVGGPAGLGRLDHPSDLDYWRFTARAGYLYEVRTGPGGTAATVVTLLDAQGRTLVRDDDADAAFGSSAGDTRLVWRCPADGDYFLAVGTWQGVAGAYAVAVRQAPDGEPSSPHRPAPLIPDHSAVTAWLASAADEHWYSFFTAASRLYHVQTFEPASTTDAVLTLWTPDGRILGRSHASPGLGWPAHGTLVSWVADRDGMTLVRVTGTGLGRYRLAVTTTAPETDGTPERARSLTLGGTPLRLSLLQGDRDWFSFKVSRWATYEVEAVPLDAGGDTDLCLYDAGWRLLAHNDDSAPGRTGSRVLWTATFSGTVLVAVTPVGGPDGTGGTGVYAIAVRRVTADGR